MIEDMIRGVMFAGKPIQYDPSRAIPITFTAAGVGEMAALVREAQRNEIVWHMNPEVAKELEWWRIVGWNLMDAYFLDLLDVGENA